MPHITSHLLLFVRFSIKYTNVLKTIDLLEAVLPSGCVPKPKARILERVQARCWQLGQTGLARPLVCCISVSLMFVPISRFSALSSSCWACCAGVQVPISAVLSFYCLLGCLYVGGGLVSVSSLWLSTHVWRASPLHWTLPNPSIICFQRCGDMGELLRPSLSPSNRAVWSGTWEWKHERTE